MGAQMAFLFAIYVVAGIFVIRLLHAKKMRTALIAYSAAFVVLALFFPVAAGCNLMVKLVGIFADDLTAYYFAGYINTPIFALNSYMTLSYCATIVVSVFLILSLIPMLVRVVAVACKALCGGAAYLRCIRNRIRIFKPQCAVCVPSAALRCLYCRFDC